MPRAPTCPGQPPRRGSDSGGDRRADTRPRAGGGLGRRAGGERGTRRTRPVGEGREPRAEESSRPRSACQWGGAGTVPTVQLPLRTPREGRAEELDATTKGASAWPVWWGRAGPGLPIPGMDLLRGLQARSGVRPEGRSWGNGPFPRALTNRALQRAQGLPLPGEKPPCRPRSLMALALAYTETVQRVTESR